MCCRSIPMAETKKSSQQVCATARVWRFNPPPASCGASLTSATSSAMTCRSNMPPRCRKARSPEPWYYIGSHEDPRKKGQRPDLRDKVTIPDVLLQAHSAPLQIAFYEADAFPADYKGSAFMTLHGSWNRGQRTGYKVVRLLFNNGRPTGEYEDFMTGFVLSEKQVWGRPVGVAVAKDGSLLVTEDGNGTIWRVSHK